MHVAFWSPGWPLERFHNGIVTYVHWMRQELERQGHRVSILTHEIDRSAQDQRVHQVTRSRWSRILRKLAARRETPAEAVFGASAAIAAALESVHRREPIDIIEMEESFGWFADIARRTSVPVAVKLHGPAFLSMVAEETETPFGREKIEREGEALRESSALLSPCLSTLKETVDRYRLEPKLSRHIVNPIALGAGTPIWSLESCDPHTVLFVGRFDLRKGGDLVLRAFAKILESHPGSRLIFVGPDVGLIAPDVGRIHFEAYRDSIIPPALRSRVDYRGRLSNQQIMELRVQAMVTVVASRWENQGYTLLEAMLQGCPVVSTNVGGCPESVINGKTGLLAAAEDPDDLAAKIRRLLDDPASAGNLGAAARRHVLELHSPATVVAQTLSFYREFLAARNR